MYRANKDKQRQKKKIVIGLITILILSIAIKVVYGNLLGPSLTYTTLTDSTILAAQSQNRQPRMDIKAIQTSLEDVLKQYQGIINSSNKANKNTLVSEVEELYSKAANDNANMKSFEVSSKNKQIINTLTQGSDCLAASLFEMKDSLMYEGDFSATQLKNSKDDLTLAIKNLELARQELKK
ncbi:MAG: hypothetical protein P4L69_19385 [Desulfosporosinus sp.]|nr:hypothetical protein [Desulfosporosinus sp.]